MALATGVANVTALRRSPNSMAMRQRYATWTPAHPNARCRSTVETGSNALSGRVVAANLVLAAWLLADAVRALIVAQDVALDIVEIIGALALISAAMFVLLRTAPLAQDLRVSSIAICLGHLFRPHRASNAVVAGLARQFVFDLR